MSGDGWSFQPQEVRRSSLPFIFCSSWWHQLLCSPSIYTILAVQLFHRERRVAPGIGNDKRELSSQDLIVAWKWATAERDVLALHRHQELKSKEKLMKDRALIHLSPLPNINTGRRNNMRRVRVRVWRHPGGRWVGNCRYIPGSITGIAQFANGWTTYFFS